MCRTRRGRPILVLNPDLRLYPGAVPQLLEALRLPGTGIVAPRVYHEDGTLVMSLRREPTLSRALGFGGTGRPGLSEYVTDPATYEIPRPATGPSVRSCWWPGSATRHFQDGTSPSSSTPRRPTSASVPATGVGRPATSLRPRSCTWAPSQGRAPASTRCRSSIGCGCSADATVGSPSMGYYLLSIASELSWIVRGHTQSITAPRALLLAPGPGRRSRLLPHGRSSLSNFGPGHRPSS